jgi:hypothetical protein
MSDPHTHTHADESLTRPDKHHDFRKIICSWFPIAGQDRVKLRRILRNWTDQVARQTETTVGWCSDFLALLHQLFHRRIPAKNRRASPRLYNVHDSVQCHNGQPAKPDHRFDRYSYNLPTKTKHQLGSCFGRSVRFRPTVFSNRSSKGNTTR